MGRIPDGDSRRSGWWLYAACRHATKLSAGDDDRGCTRSETRSRERPVPGGLDGVGRSCERQPGAQSKSGGASVPGFKCFLIHPGIDGFTMVNEQELRAALPHVARTGLPLLVHAELPGRVDAATRRLAGADWSKYATYLESRPDEAELSAIQLMISLCREYHFRVHIVHLATSQALGMLRAAKSEGLPVSVETCPHYLHLSSEKIPDGQTLFKCAPPIRSRENGEKLWQGLREESLIWWPRIILLVRPR